MSARRELPDPGWHALPIGTSRRAHLTVGVADLFQAPAVFAQHAADLRVPVLRGDHQRRLSERRSAILEKEGGGAEGEVVSGENEGARTV